MDIKYDTYKEIYLDKIIEFWNRNFQKKRNFFKITPDIFKERVINKIEPLETLDINGIFLALDEEKVVGMIHCGIHKEEFCKLCYPDWKGGSQGYIAFIFVDKEYRKCGIGSTLWTKAMDFIKNHQESDLREIIIDGQCISPYYGNSEGPMISFWGTTEGISIEWDDWDTRRFFKKFGYEPRFKAITLEAQLKDFVVDDLSALKNEVESKGFIFKHLKNLFPVLNQSLYQYIPFPRTYSFDTIVTIKDEKTKGYIVFYEMRELNEGRSGIYEITVAEDTQKMRLGSCLLKMALDEIKRRNGQFCEVLTVPELSPGALEMYQKCGFKKVCEWAVY